MAANRTNRVLAWAVTLSVLAAAVVLVWFLPLVAALIFVGCITIVALTVGRSRGFWSGLKVFIKEILFGW
jgi:hypothetical protein